MLFFSNLLRFLSSPKQTARRTQPRKLVNESLENRKLLAGDVIDSGEYCEAAEIAANEQATHQDNVQNAAAQLKIEGFSGVPTGSSGSGVFWTFRGKVVGRDDVEDLTVSFGGMLEGAASATTEHDGSFVVRTSLSADALGAATAVVADDDGNESEVAWFLVYS